LVRRLLENTSNESFVRRRFKEGEDLEELLTPPAVSELPALEAPVRRPPTEPSSPGPYHHEPVAEWRRASVRGAFSAAVGQTTLGLDVPALVGGAEVRTAATIVS